MHVQLPYQIILRNFGIVPDEAKKCADNFLSVFRGLSKEEYLVIILG